MTSSRRTLVILQSVALLLLAGGMAPASADSPTAGTAASPMAENKVPGSVESTARRLTNSLKQQGYEVARG